MALLLQEKFEGGDLGGLDLKLELDGVEIEVPSTALDNAVEQLMVFSSYGCANEYELSALLTRTMDRFLFSDADVKLGACLSQFPLQHTKRADLVVVKLGEDWTPSLPVILTNDSKKTSDLFETAVRETQCYTICGLTKSLYKFPYSFGMPYGKSRMALEMHIIIDGKLQCIHIAETQFGTKEHLRKFLSVTYWAIHWLLRDEGRKSNTPRGPRPTKDLELVSSFSNRVFLKDCRIYKFYETDGTRKANVEVLEMFGYMCPVKYNKLSDKFQLVSYPYLKGSHVPQTCEQLIRIGDLLHFLHNKNLVHGDIRCTNLIFGHPHKSESESYIIDFDYTSKPGDYYPSTYNGGLDERHPDAQAHCEKRFEHDWYSLCFICNFYFPPLQHDYNRLFKNTVLGKHLYSHF